MAYDEGLAERLRELLTDVQRVKEKKMFGGLAFMVRGHMTVCVVDDNLMARVGPAEYPAALKKKHVREMDFTGRPLKGYVYIDPPGFESDKDLAKWVKLALAFNASMEAK